MCPRALALLERVRALGLPGERVFPVGRDTLEQLVRKRLKKEWGLDVHGHGFRATFRSWAEKTKFKTQVIETAMAHDLQADGETKEAYLDNDFYLEERHPLMAAWGSFLSGAGENVVPLARGEEPELATEEIDDKESEAA